MLWETPNKSFGQPNVLWDDINQIILSNVLRTLCLNKLLTKEDSDNLKICCMKNTGSTVSLILVRKGLKMLCLMSESPSGKREGFQDNATCKKKEVYC